MAMGLVALINVLLPTSTVSPLIAYTERKHAHLRQDVPHDLPVLLRNIRQLGPRERVVQICQRSPESDAQSFKSCSEERAHSISACSFQGGFAGCMLACP